MKSQRGFTLLELLVVLAVAAILVGYALPSYKKMVRSNRVATQANSLLAAFYTARSEAVRRSATVTLCVSANQTSCDTSAGASSWGEGWIVFVPASAGAPTTTTGITPLLTQQALAGGNTGKASDTGSGSLVSTASPSGVDYITYNGNGFGSTTGYVKICDSGGTSVVPAAGVLIQPGGRPQVSATDTTGTTFACP